ncbi:MAG: hypothetical protein KF764_28550 [Labilithrix sp.]|nr:hypothetical protein [Labilithrix sp.]MBX3220339.1 hypothetical protein [Labilithrix sp.]
MDYRGVLLITAVLGAGAFASSTACSGPDPGALTFAERQTQGSTGDPGSSGTSGTPGTGDGGATEGGAAVDPVFGTTPFTYVDPGVTANDANPAHGGTVEGKDCIVGGCHLEGGRPWVFGGTVYTAAQGGAVVPKAEIKIVAPNGSEVGTTYTDANGNFWLEKDGTTIPAGSKVGVRREGGAEAKHMITALQPTDRGCSANRANCHGTGGTGRVYVP